MRRRGVGRGLGGCLLALGLLGCDARDLATVPEQLRTQTAESVDPADVIDALFMGSGPLIPRDGNTACPLTRMWSGFPRGTTVRVRASRAVPADAHAGLRAAVDQVAGATDGVVRAVFDVVDGDPEPRGNDVTVIVRDRPREEGCPSDRGCVMHVFREPGVLLSGRVVEPPDQPVQEYVRHTVGRGILGLCQIDARLIGDAGGSLMSAGPGVRPGEGAASLTALDLTATRAVYASPLNPGATRKDFLQAGLVRVQAGERRRAASAN